MSYLVAGTAIIWVTILGYVMSLSIRQKKLTKRIDHIERSEGM